MPSLNSKEKDKVDDRWALPSEGEIARRAREKALAKAARKKARAEKSNQNVLESYHNEAFEVEDVVVGDESVPPVDSDKAEESANAAYDRGKKEGSKEARQKARKDAAQQAKSNLEETARQNAAYRTKLQRLQAKLKEEHQQQLAMEAKLKEWKQRAQQAERAAGEAARKAAEAEACTKASEERIRAEAYEQGKRDAAQAQNIGGAGGTACITRHGSNCNVSADGKEVSFSGPGAALLEGCGPGSNVILQLAEGSGDATFGMAAADYDVNNSASREGAYSVAADGSLHSNGNCTEHHEPFAPGDLLSMSSNADGTSFEWTKNGKRMKEVACLGGNVACLGSSSAGTRWRVLVDAADVLSARAAWYEKGKREAEEKAKKEAEERAANAQKEAEERAASDAAAQAKRDAEEQAKREAEAAKVKELEAKLQEAEEKLRAAEAQAQADAEAKAGAGAAGDADSEAKKRADEKAKKEAEENARKEAEEKLRAEAYEKGKQEAEEKTKKEAEERAASDAAAHAKRDAEEQAKREAEAAKVKELEAKLQEAEEKLRAAEAQAQADAEAKTTAGSSEQLAAKPVVESSECIMQFPETFTFTDSGKNGTISEDRQTLTALTALPATALVGGVVYHEATLRLQLAQTGAVGYVGIVAGSYDLDKPPTGLGAWSLSSRDGDLFADDQVVKKHHSPFNKNGTRVLLRYIATAGGGTMVWSVNGQEQQTVTGIDSRAEGATFCVCGFGGTVWSIIGETEWDEWDGTVDEGAEEEEDDDEEEEDDDEGGGGSNPFTLSSINNHQWEAEKQEEEDDEDDGDEDDDDDEKDYTAATASSTLKAV
jgi:hypothetical protein